MPESYPPGRPQMKKQKFFTTAFLISPLPCASELKSTSHSSPSATPASSPNLLHQLRSLDEAERIQVAGLVRRLRANYRLRPVFFSLRASLAAFLILAVLPAHPMSLFIAFGGGLSISLLIH